MMRTFRTGFLLASFFLMLQTCFSQSTDWEGWAGISLQKKITKELRVNAKTNLRMRDNISAYKNSYAQVSLRYRPIKWMRFTAGYRQIWRDGQSANQSRLFGSTTLVRRWHKRLDTRYRLQYQFDKANNREWSIGENTVRQKLTTSWRKKKTDITWTVGGEIFYGWQGRGGAFDKYRLIFDASYKINKRQSISLGYLFQSELGKGNIDRANILSLDYSLEIR